jgi:NADP-dependent 3-hydroxy acid dehydrogenase YdfG
MLLGPMLEAPVEEWQQMVEVNLLGLMYMTKAAVPHLLEAAEGDRGVADVVNISSVAGRIARRNSGVYNATKFGVGAFSESLRQEVTRRRDRQRGPRPPHRAGTVTSRPALNWGRPRNHLVT